MLDSTIVVDAPLASLHATLTRLAHAPPDLIMLRHASKAADDTFGHTADGLDADAPDLAERARTAYFAGLALAKILECFIPIDNEMAIIVRRFRGTAVRILDTLERVGISASHRALRASLLAPLEPPSVEHHLAAPN